MTYITPQGLEELKKEFKERTGRRSHIAKAIKQAKEQGDLSENAEYSQAKAQQGENERRMRWLKKAIKSARVVQKSNGEAIDIGATVKIEKGKNTITVQVVGTHETNPAEGKISCESPLGKSLIGKTKGEKVSVETPSGSEVYLIRSVE